MDTSEAWHFTSYEKIAETPEQWQLDEAGFRQLEKTQWVVTEKIHGANFCFISNGRELSCANRKNILGPQDNFFQYQSVARQLQERIFKLFQRVQQRYSTASMIFLYGELFGGGYPHPQVVANPAFQPIQTGIFYTPEIAFCAFDLALSNKARGEERIYLDYAEAIELFKEVDLLYARPLLIGSFQEALNYPLGFQSTLPALLGLPALPTDNRAEGIVIKPYYTIVVSSKKGLLRPILKKKIPEFAEDKRFSQAQKWSDQAHTFAQEQEHLEALKWEVFNLVTENRLQSAISKIGPVTRDQPKKAQQLFRLVVDDVLEQLYERAHEHMAALGDADSLLLQHYIRVEVRKLFKDHLQPQREAPL